MLFAKKGKWGVATCVYLAQHNPAGMAKGGGGGGLFLACKGFGENVRPFMLRLHFFFFLSGDLLARTYTTSQVRISQQRLSDLRRLRSNLP